MVDQQRRSGPWKRQIDTTASLLATSSGQVIHAVDLHKAKFDQQKAYAEYHGDEPVRERLDEAVFDRSVEMVTERTASSIDQSFEEVSESVAAGGQWIGTFPVALNHSMADVFVVGYPYLLGFIDGTPRVVLNVILPEKPENMERFYANEWARPWVIANLLDSSGFDTSELLLGTLKARESSIEPELEAENVGGFLDEIATETVRTVLGDGIAEDTTLPAPAEPSFDHLPKYVRAQFVDFDPQLYEQLGHGDGFRHIIEMFLGEREPKGTPPDRGLSLEYAL